MVLERERYAPNLTSLCVLELQKFSKWFNNNQGGNWPTVIGGWAVWAYYSDGFGSRDVDLIFPATSWIDEMMKKVYLPGSGFKEFKIGDPIFGEIHYGKPVGDDQIIFFDMIPADAPREDSVGLGVSVDWSWVYEDEHKMPIGGDAFINVPELELLITLKIIGCISRNRKLRMAYDQRYFESKIWKDCYDVGNLTTHLDPNNERMTAHISRTGLGRDLLLEFLEICEGHMDAFDEGGSNTNHVETLPGLAR